MEISKLMSLATYGASSSSSTSNTSSTSSSGLDMTDFLKLLAAQFTNQDITNPTDSTEYVSELAQFASLQAVNTLTAYADRQYAASLVGKTVQAKSTDQTGKTAVETGVVSYADFSSSDGSSSVVVNGHVYDPSAVIRILEDSGTTDGSGKSGTADPAAGTQGTEDNSAAG